MSYKELLDNSRWDNIRKKVLKRDSYKCTNCENTKIERRYSKGDVLEFDLDNSALLDPKYQLNKSDPRFSEPKITIRLIVKTREDIQKSLQFQTYDEFFNNEVINDDTSLKAYYSNDLSSDDLIEYYDENSETSEFLIWGIKGTSKNEWLYVRYIQIHHTYYQQGNYPWEYPLDSLQTLCRSCHKEVHASEKIPTYDCEGRRIGEYTTCRRCHGMGWFRQYRHVEGGICFRCNGARYEQLIN